MLEFRWNEDKNVQLKHERGVSFENVVAAVTEGRVFEVRNHPNQERYPNQNIYIVQIESYVYIVPYVSTDYGAFLKTIIPSRKETKKHLYND